MYVVFLFPMVLSVFAAYQFLSGDFGRGAKITVAILVVTSLALQFVPPLRESAHFLFPLGLQLIVCAWWYFANQFDSF